MQSGEGDTPDSASYAPAEMRGGKDYTHASLQDRLECRSSLFVVDGADPGLGAIHDSAFHSHHPQTFRTGRSLRNASEASQDPKVLII
jgi:hypothetical protein